MTRLWQSGSEIEIKSDPHGKIISFIWQGRTHPIQKVHQRWQVNTDWWSEEGEAHREYLALTTTDGFLCVIFKDLLNDAWYLAKLYD